VLTGPIAAIAPITRERKRQSYQLSWRADATSIVDTESRRLLHPNNL
jgi:hypothetical protein